MDGLKIIPQLFYDLMARIIPGSIAILALTAAGNVTLGQVRDKVFQSVPTLPDTSLVSITTFLLGAYLMGHLIDSLRDMSEWTVKWTVKRKLFSRKFISKATQCIRIISTKLSPSFCHTLEKSLEALCTTYLQCEADRLFKRTLYGAVTEKDKLDSVQKADAIYLWYDWLRVQKADVGARLTKLRAEYHMLERIAYVLFLALILHLLVWTGARRINPEIALNWYLVIGSCLGFIMSSRAAAKACWSFQWSTINHYMLMNSESNTANISPCLNNSVPNSVAPPAPETSTQLG